MALNNQVFNAALAGFLAGAELQRSLTSAVDADYAGTVNAAVAFATQVDAGIPNDAAFVTPTSSAAIAKSNLIQSICGAVIANRFPTSATAGDYATLAAACCALYRRAVLSLQLP
jgi:predicted deacylase